MKLFLILLVLSWSSLSYGLLIDRDKNHLYISERVFKKSYEFFTIEFANANMELALAGDTDSPIYLHLDIPEGGLGYYAFQIVDIIKQAATYGTKVITIVEEDKLCTSACTFIFLAGQERRMAPNARLAFHGFNYDPKKVSQESIDELTAMYEQLLEESHPNLLPLFKEGRIIEDNQWVAFTGQTLIDYEPLNGLVTPLED